MTNIPKQEASVKSLTVFNELDCDYLIQRFSLPELQEQLSKAMDAIKISRDDQEEVFWTDYVEVCEIAIKRIRQSTPRKYQGSSQIDFRLLKKSIDIIDLIGRYIRLRKSSDKFSGLCPFHADKKTPSFFVYPKSQSWHCFGCQKNGDVFDFIKLIEHCDIKQAVQILRG